MCGVPQVDTLVREDEDPQYGVNLRPSCDNFANSGGTTHFTWPQLNGGFAGGNPHRPWGMVEQRLKNGLEYVASNYANFAGIRLTSGYRCPHGNATMRPRPGARNSAHVHGIAGDLLRDGWTEAEFNEVKIVAEDGGGFEINAYSRYPNRHLHVAF